jgi:hypothetical protein
MLDLDTECQASQTRFNLPGTMIAIFTDEAMVCLDSGEVLHLKDLAPEEKCLLISRGGIFTVSDKCKQTIEERAKKNRGRWK